MHFKSCPLSSLLRRMHKLSFDQKKSLKKDVLIRIKCDPFCNCLQVHFYQCERVLYELTKFIIQSNESHYDQINEINKPARFHKFRGSFSG
jgi:hypothetical protein